MEATLPANGQRLHCAQRPTCDRIARVSPADPSAAESKHGPHTAAKRGGAPHRSDASEKGGSGDRQRRGGDYAVTRGLGEIVR